MNKELRRVSTVLLLMFLSLFISSSIIQVVQVDTLTADGRNVRVLYDSFSRQRGAILVGGVPIAESVPSDDAFSYLRVYAEPKVYAAVTGYLTLNQGNTGLESALNDYLSGTSNDQWMDRINALLTGQDPEGASVELTIDPDVQAAAWKALGNNKGAIVAIEPSTGRILAMVSKTSFDPNELSAHASGSAIISRYNDLLSDASKPLVNRAISGDLYHPGSVFKLVMTAAALESGQYTPESKFKNPARLKLPQSTVLIRNVSGGTCGSGSKATIATALRLSCNIPFAQLGVALGQDRIAEQATKFGFGEKLDIPLTVTPSIYPTGMDDAQLMLSSFGQYDDRVTPLQMAMVSSAIANGGVLMTPNLVDRITAADLTPLKTFDPAIFSNPISAQTATTMTEMMVNGVNSGAASNARISGVEVAGKTGTAENGVGEPYTLWFTGFAPANNPKVAIAVVVENSGGKTYDAFGNTVAAPMAKKVLEAVLGK
jgi:penicillin-binding protein A